MQAAVADTHSLIWMASAPERLGRRASRFLARAARGECLVYVPSVALVEIGEAMWRGRFEPQGGLDAWQERLFSNPAFQPASLTVAMAIRAHGLHAIPERTNRLLAATALELECPLITHDAEIAASGEVATLW